MSLLTKDNAIVLWQDAIRCGQERCAITLKEELEAYLVALVIRYTNQPEIGERCVANAFLEAIEGRARERKVLLQHIGDQCLLFSGFFPHFAEKRHVKISYFVNLGRLAYSTVSIKTNDLYWSLALQFVALMDILQSIRQCPDLLPIEAYEQWNEVGSKRALNILRSYAKGIPLRQGK